MVRAAVAGTRSAKALKSQPLPKGPVHVKIMVVVQNNNGDNFQWYFSKEQSFNGIFLKM
jgi:hypothetical protein